MVDDRLSILWVAPMPASPPKFGGQMRMHGLMTALAKRHDVTVVSLADSTFDVEECRTAMGRYCREVVLVPNPNPASGPGKRALQLRSMVSPRSFEWHRYSVPALQEALDAVSRRASFDVATVEFPYIAHYRFRSADRPGERLPMVLDTHEIEYDILRQVAGSEAGGVRRVYNSLNWRKVRSEERAAFRLADAIAVCSADDERRVLADAPGARTAIVPNAADVEHFSPKEAGTRGDGRTVLFFGTMGYFPNVDGVLYLLREIWPLVAASHPEARLKIVGPRPPPEVLAHRGPRVEVTGFVEDLRPHLEEAAVLVVPLRLGGGTRLKIVEGMSMGRPIVSTTLGAEGIDAVDGRDILIADGAEAFSAAVGRVLGAPALAARLGEAGRRLALEKYSWKSAGDRLEALLRLAIEARKGARP